MGRGSAEKVGGVAGSPAGIVTICAECKRVIGVPVRSADGRQQAVSHGICTECARRLYGHLFETSGRGTGESAS